MENLSFCVKKADSLSCPKLGRKRTYQRPVAEIVNQAPYLMNGDTVVIGISGTVDPEDVDAKQGTFEDLTEEEPKAWGDPWSDVY
jgi:hypothetical protein